MSPWVRDPGGSCTCADPSLRAARGWIGAAPFLSAQAYHPPSRQQFIESAVKEAVTVDSTQSRGKDRPSSRQSAPAPVELTREDLANRIEALVRIDPSPLAVREGLRRMYLDGDLDVQDLADRGLQVAP